MIKNAQEARDALNIFKDRTSPITNSIYLHEYKFAEGYLAALNGPEVKALVDALENIQFVAKTLSWKVPRGISIYSQNPEYKFASLLSEIELAGDSALAQYRAATKEIK